MSNKPVLLIGANGPAPALSSGISSNVGTSSNQKNDRFKKQPKQSPQPQSNDYSGNIMITYWH